MKIGIYRLYNTITNNSYIGQSRDIDKRLVYHEVDLKSGEHHNKSLQTEFNYIVNKMKESLKDNKYFNYIDFKKYIYDTYYKVDILQTFDIYNEKEIKEIEDEYIIKYKSINKYNFTQLTNKEIEIMKSEYDKKKELKRQKENEELNYINNIESSGDYIKANDEYDLNFTINGVNIKHKNKFDPLNSRNPITEVLAFIFNNKDRDLNNITIKYISFYCLWKYRQHNGEYIKSVLKMLIENDIITTNIKIHKLKINDTFNINIINDDILNKVKSLLDKYYIDYV